MKISVFVHNGSVLSGNISSGKRQRVKASGDCVSCAVARPVVDWAGTSFRPPFES